MSPQVDVAEIQRTLSYFHTSGDVLELRILGTRCATVSGYFDDMQALAQNAAQWSGRASGVYITPNPCQPALLARAHNRLRTYVKKGDTTTDVEILCRRWLLADFDSCRPAGISAADAEHEAALQRARACRAWLQRTGWPLPIFADSGNGAHLLYRLTLPNDECGRQLLQRCLKALAERFTDAAVKVDTGMFNAARIWKLYGTLACKGDLLPDRPHRLTRLLDVPASLEVVSQAHLEALAALAVSPNPPLRPLGQTPPVSLDDQTLLDKIFAASNGAAVRRLWDGDTSAHPSPSEADLALCGHLAFWTGGDAARIDALFRQSALYRENKWQDRDDYRERTITKALERHDFYRPRSRPGDNDPWLGPKGARAGIPLTVRRA